MQFPRDRQTTEVLIKFLEAIP